jgi:hypothetical protein
MTTPIRIGVPARQSRYLNNRAANSLRPTRQSVGFVGYGGARSVEIPREVVSNVELADARAQVGLSLFTDFENFTTFKSGSNLEPTVTGMLDQVIACGGALKPLRVATSG